jgi:hypothetical protein
LYDALLAKRNRRNKIPVPDKLQDIVIKSISKNITFFKNKVENPFENLRTYPFY